jgi:RHS repeat-associated protein
MVKGSNAEGKESEYTYNGLGYLIRLEQGLKNPNNLFINNHNTGGNRYIGLLEDEANEGITIPEGQQTYDDNYGLTRQREEKTTTEYVIDYTSQYEQNIMEYTDGRYVVRNTFGVSKVSQSAYTVDSAINVTGNPSHTIATEDIQKAYFHYDRMGSTVYVSSQAGNLLAYTAYDEWGNVQNQKQLDMNFSGLDRTVNYTGHDYDEVLEKYFAQARLYDPSTKRFLSPDPLGQGSNLYIYCKDNSLAFTDPEGLSPVKIREYVNKYSYQYYTNVGWNASSKISTFTIGSKTLSSTANGSNGAGINIWNQNDYLMAQDYELDRYFFYVASTTSSSSASIYSPAPPQVAQSTNYQNLYTSNDSPSVQALPDPQNNYVFVSPSDYSSSSERALTFTSYDISALLIGLSDSIDSSLFFSLINFIANGGYDHRSQMHTPNEVKSYYLGKVIGDIIGMTIAAGEIYSGLSAIGTSIGGGSAITVLSGGTLVIGGVSVAAAGIIAGATAVGVGASSLEISYDNFQNDLDELSKAENNIPTSDDTLNNVYSSIKKAPKYPSDFVLKQNGTKKYNINNSKLLEELRKIEPGKWHKIYKDGYAGGQKVSIHYFESTTGKVFDVAVKLGWSN